MTKNEIIIYEDAMCCSSGLCGPEPDRELVLLNETIKKLEAENADLTIRRASLSTDINLFIENKEIFQMIKEKGQNILPITTLNGKIIAQQRHVTYTEAKKLMGSQ